MPRMPPRGRPPPNRSSNDGIPVGRRYNGGVDALRAGRVPPGAGLVWAVGVRRVKDGMAREMVERWMDVQWTDLVEF